MKQFPLNEKIITDVFNRVVVKSLGGNPTFASDPMKMDGLIRELLGKRFSSKKQAENLEAYVGAVKRALLEHRLKLEGMSPDAARDVVEGAKGAEARHGGLGSSHK
jgi:hypothetical protein